MTSDQAFAKYLEQRNRDEESSTSPTRGTRIAYSLLLIGGGLVLIGGTVHAALATLPQAREADDAYARYKGLAGGGAGYYLAWDDFARAREDALKSAAISGGLLGGGLLASSIGLVLWAKTPSLQRSVDDFPKTWPGGPAPGAPGARLSPVRTAIVPYLGGATLRMEF